MKAAVEVGGAENDLFHRGVAKESKDPEVVAATMVGSNGLFTEHAALPYRLADEELNGRQVMKCP